MPAWDTAPKPQHNGDVDAAHVMLAVVLATAVLSVAFTIGLSIALRWLA